MMSQGTQASVMRMALSFMNEVQFAGIAKHG